MEIEDVNYEFERDRTEYLGTIRKQEKEIAFLQVLTNREPTASAHIYTVFIYDSL